MPLTTEYTTFTRDVLGRYVCNTFEEAIGAIDANARAAAGLPQRGDLRQFDFIIIGEDGRYWSAVAGAGCISLKVGDEERTERERLGGEEDGTGGAAEWD